MTTRARVEKSAPENTPPMSGVMEALREAVRKEREAKRRLEAAILDARKAGATLMAISEVLEIRHQSLSEYLRRREP